MSVVTYEGVVEDGQIRLKADVRLPNRTKVYVLVPEDQAAPVARVISPRLAHPEQGADFRIEISETAPDASA
jgi:hypothetical protein